MVEQIGHVSWLRGSRDQHARQYGCRSITRYPPPAGTRPQAEQFGVVALRLHYPHRFPPDPSRCGSFDVRPQSEQRGSCTTSKPFARRARIKLCAVGDASDQPEVSKSGLRASSLPSICRAFGPPALATAFSIEESARSGILIWHNRAISRTSCSESWVTTLNPSEILFLVAVFSLASVEGFRSSRGSAQPLPQPLSHRSLESGSSLRACIQEQRTPPL